MRYKQPKAYMDHIRAGTQIQQQAEIGRHDLSFEFMLNALRLNHGFDANLFAERTGMPLNAIEKQLDLAEAKGLLRRKFKRIRPTELGRRFLNDLQQIFLHD
jgi:oxygen-independent coproporphyrinogen-3 oxidase